MKRKKLPELEEVYKCLSYDSGTGLFSYKDRLDSVGRLRRFKSHGGVTNRGYIIINVGGESYCAHRLVYKMFNGTEPENIDHADGNPGNNRVGNLRMATVSQNNSNSRLKAGKSLPKGVKKNCNKYEARIRVDGQLIYLGLFDSPERAHDEYVKAARKHRKQFARTK